MKAQWLGGGGALVTAWFLLKPFQWLHFLALATIISWVILWAIVVPFRAEIVSLALAESVLFFFLWKRQPLRTLPKTHIHTNLPTKSAFKKCNGSAHVYLRKMVVVSIFAHFEETDLPVASLEEPFPLLHTMYEQRETTFKLILIHGLYQPKALQRACQIILKLNSITD